MLIVVVVGGLWFYFYKKSAQEVKAPDRETVVKDNDQTAQSGSSTASTQPQTEQLKATSTIKTEIKIIRHRYSGR